MNILGTRLQESFIVLIDEFQAAGNTLPRTKHFVDTIIVRLIQVLRPIFRVQTGWAEVEGHQGVSSWLW